MRSEQPTDPGFMRRAIELARRANQDAEVPVGALVVVGGEVIGEGWNMPVATHDPTAHAEIVALRAAGKFSRNYRLPGSTLARIRRLGLEGGRVRQRDRSVARTASGAANRCVWRRMPG